MNSNKTQLQTNNTILDSLIARVNLAKDTAASLPEAGGGSSGSNENIKTCTIVLDNESVSYDCPIVYVSTMVYENGKHDNYSYFGPQDGNYKLTIPNVVCGCKITLIAWMYNGDVPFVDIDGGASYESYVNLSHLATGLRALTITAPINADENCTIYYAYEA